MIIYSMKKVRIPIWSISSYPQTHPVALFEKEKPTLVMSDRQT